MILNFLLKFEITGTEECVCPFRYTLRQTSCHPEFSTSNIIQHRTRISILGIWLIPLLFTPKMSKTLFNFFILLTSSSTAVLSNYFSNSLSMSTYFMGLDLIGFLFLLLSQLYSMLIFCVHFYIEHKGFSFLILIFYPTNAISIFKHVFKGEQ